MNNPEPLVAILIGSKSDWEFMRPGAYILDELGIPYEARVLSAHRTPDRLREYILAAKERGLRVIIAGAGLSAALPGAIAALTPLPVLGVPLPAALMGLDSLLAIAQMPPGIPVGTLAIGKPGAVNAALLATAILALSDSKIAWVLDKYREEQTAKVLLESELK